MGTITTKLKSNKQISSSHSIQQSNNHINPKQNVLIKQTPYTIWQHSNKTIEDLLTYINSISNQNQQIQYERIGVYISSIKDREKLYEVLNQVQKQMLGMRNKEGMNEVRNLSNSFKSKIIKLVHPKLANIWFVWHQLISAHHLTPSMIHQRILPQISIQNYSIKLQILYNLTKQLPALPLLNLTQNKNPNSYISTDLLLSQAMSTNYPFLLTQQSIQNLFNHIIQTDVIIENINHFCYFIQYLIIQSDMNQNKQQLQEYVQKIYYYMNQDYEDGIQGQNRLKQYLEKQKIQGDRYKIYHIILEAGRKFLQFGNSHAMQLLFQTILTLNNTISTKNSLKNSLKNSQYLTLTQQQIKLYLYNQIYSLFLYNLHQINLQYKHLQKMTISNIIHLLLKDNQIGNLGKLEQIFTNVQNISVYLIRQGQANIYEQNKQELQIQQVYNQYIFQQQLRNYIFSNYCPLQICLQILTQTTYITLNPPNNIQPHPQPYSQHNLITQQLHNKIITKLSQSKFQLIIQNQNYIKIIIINNFQYSIHYKDVFVKIEEILEIVRLLYMFGVNQKFGAILVFYCHGQIGQGDRNRNSLSRRSSQIQIIQQQKALQLFKIFISKYYISADRTKKILLNSKSQSPISIDLSKSQAIFQISQYLYQKLFIKSLNSIKDIYQLIFQHMIYFYKYQQAKNILSNQSILTKYMITIQSFQLIILNNIIQSIQKSSDLNKILPDLNQQIKLLKSRNSVEVQSARAMVKLVGELNSYGIQLSLKDRNRIGIQLMEAIVEKYGDRIQVINFDNIYQEIRTINADYVLDEDEKFMMTNDLLKFKSKLAAKAYSVGKKTLGNQLIDQISRFNPPWLTSSLIYIFKNTPSLKFDKRIYGIAMKSCAKGQDLQYLMQLWKQQEGKQKRKQKGFAQFAEYFETGRQYIVIDDSFIGNQERYRNHVAESQFNDQMLHLKKYWLFFVLLGTQLERGFHYGLNVGLDPIKIQVFLREAMKTNIINPSTCINYLHKYFYFAWKMQQQKTTTKSLPSYSSYTNFVFNTAQLETILQKLKKSKNKRPTSQFYTKILSAYLCSLYLNQKFINTYFCNIPQKTNITYQLLFDQQSRKTMLINLRQQPMGRSDIFTLNLLCEKVIDVNLIQLCIFNLCNIANTSQKLQQKSENIMQKIVTLTSGKKKQCQQIVSKLIQKIFSIKKLVQILQYLSSRENPIYQQIVKKRNLQVIQNLALIQVGQELHGLVPSTFFNKEIMFDPVWPISANHQIILRRCLAKTNIFVLSKVMYFIYGMNPAIQTKIWQDYLVQHPDDEQLRQIKQQLDKLKKYQSQ